MIRWRWKWQTVDDKPNTLTDPKIHAKLELYPNIHVVTIPETSTKKRDPSVPLKRIKTYFRSSMIEDRLNGLSIMYLTLTRQSDGNRK